MSNSCNASGSSRIFWYSLQYGIEYNFRSCLFLLKFILSKEILGICFD